MLHVARAATHLLTSCSLQLLQSLFTGGRLLRSQVLLPLRLLHQPYHLHVGLLVHHKGIAEMTTHGYGKLLALRGGGARLQRKHGTSRDHTSRARCAIHIRTDLFRYQLDCCSVSNQLQLAQPHVHN